MKIRHYCALIVAAGSGSRMKSETPKQLMPYKGETVLGAAAAAFACNKNIESLVITIPGGASLREGAYFDIAEGLHSEYDKEVHLICGGEERFDSVRLGLEKVSAMFTSSGISSDDVFVLIHDGARPAVGQEIIDRNIAALDNSDAVCTAVKTVDSMRIKSLNSELYYPIIKTEFIDRNNLYNVQTPQSFRLSTICKAYDAAVDGGFRGTDDASVAEHAGVDISVCEGSYANIKITTKEDMPMSTRTGIGFDVHRLADGRDLILCGAPVPGSRGLTGHSDADVATHALMDAILGAAGKGDIGKHFPDTDDEYAGARSLDLLSDVMKIAGDVSVVNADITIIAEEPRLAPYIDEMRRNIAAALGIPAGAVNVKATTTEGLGFTGSGEGIAAMATCSIEGRFFDEVI